VLELRRRKRRDEKPFAVMVRDLETAQRYAELSPAEVQLLCSPSRPIVLAPLREGLAPSLAPGLSQVGLLLPYTPMHELVQRHHEVVGRDVPQDHPFEAVDVVQAVVRRLVDGLQQRTLWVVTPHLREAPDGHRPPVAALLLERTA
jgi:tRNA A37 threonylcarbamoyladenosine synthetase subunit TsaC/SUA5/YrdC